MCDVNIVNKVAIVDLSRCPFEFASPEFINYHLKNLVATAKPIKKIRYEEEIVFELNEKNTAILMEYVSFLRELEKIILNKDIYGHPQDPYYHKRKEFLYRVYEAAYMSPREVVKLIDSYEEPTPTKAIFFQGYRKFKQWLLGIKHAVEKTELYSLVVKYGDMRKAFLSLIGTKSMFFVDLIKLDLPEEAKPIKGEKSQYKLNYGITVKIYEWEEKGLFYYVIENPVLDSLPKELKILLKELIDKEMKESYQLEKIESLYSKKFNDYKEYFLETAVLKDIPISPEQATVMAREAVSWVFGLGSPIENIALDENVTDIYIDSENSPIYLEHADFGILHTLYRYNREMLERVFRNIVFYEKGKKFDDKNPVVDVVVKRLNMRCHLQRPPATFGELQGALRIMKPEPFTYALYLYYNSFTPFFSGYDDVMVSLGSSEAVLGLKGVGKTSFTAAKILAIGPNRRIIPVQDIEEIPVLAYRKRGYHIGAAKVASGDIEVTRSSTVLDLVSLTNALLRMGDAAIIINEVRSRSAVQGIINLLNTQPGVFLLYNLHSESLEDVRDRLELVFGIPAASMFATDRYTFLKKVRFGRGGKVYRVLGYEYESDKKNRKFVKVFDFKRGSNIETSSIQALFLNNKEAMSRDLSSLDFRRLEKDLDIKFLPPALVRRSETTGVKPEQFILQAFFKGKVYSDIYNLYLQTGNKSVLGLDFVHMSNVLANKIILKHEKENGDVDFSDVAEEWNKLFKEEARSYL